MANDVSSTLTIQTKLAEDAKLAKFMKDSPGQWRAIEKAAQAANVSLTQVQESLAQLGTQKNFLQMAAEGASFTNKEWTQLASVIKKLGYEQLKIQAETALATQAAIKQTQAQTSATDQLAKSTNNLANAKKNANNQTVGATKGGTGQGLLVEQKRGANQVQRQLGQIDVDKNRADQEQLVLQTRERERRQTKLFEFELEQRGRALRKLQSIEEQSVSASVALQNKLTAAIKASNLAYERSQMIAGGMRPSQALQSQLNAASFGSFAAQRGIRTGATPNTSQWQQQMNSAIQQQLITSIASSPPRLTGARVNVSAWQKAMNSAIFNANANYLAQSPPQAIAPISPRLNAANWQKAMNAAIFNANSNYLAQAALPQFPAAGGAGKGGAWQKILGTLGFGSGGGFTGSLLRNVAGATGIGAGAYAVVGMTQAAIDATKAATAYDRMEVSARKLAGSQEQLNSLIDAYSKASGGAIDQATTLEQIMRLQATGFAKTAEEVERFVRGSRGAALALGKPQEFVIQETQLAVSNTSVKRLDQIGLGIAEVDKRTKELRETNQGWTREMAFQEAVIGLLNEKYGSLSDTIEGQATGIEKLSVTFSNMGLAIGQSLQGPLNTFANGLNKILIKAKELNDYLENFGANIDNAVYGWFGMTPPAGTDTQVYKPPSVIIPPSERGGFTAPKQAAEVPFLDEREAMAKQRAERLVEIERQMNNDLEQERRDYVQGVTDSWNSYYKTLARDNEDYQRSRAKSEANFARQVAQVHEEAADREIKAARDLMNQIVRMNRDAAREEARAQRDFDRSMQEMDEDYGKRLEEIHDDYGKRIEDLEEDHGRNIAEAREDSLERLTEMQTEHDDRITKAREDSSKQLTELEAAYAKDRKRAFEQYQLSNLEAAANLDGKTLWMNAKRFELETKQAQEAHQEAIDKEKKRLSEFEQEANRDHQEAIDKEKKRLKEFEDEANKSHKRRLDEEKESLKEREDQEVESLSDRKKDAKESYSLQRKDAQDALKLQQQDLIDAHAAQKTENDAADSQRLLDMKAAHLLEQGEAEADRLFRLGRMEVDHQEQLTRMGTQHTARILQIETHAQEERDKIGEEHIKALLELGVYIEGWSLQHAKAVQVAIEGFNDWLLGIEEGLGREGLTPAERERITGLEAQQASWQTIVDDPNRSQTDKNWAQSQINALQLQINDIKAGRTSGNSVSQAPFSGVVKPVTNSATTSGILGGGTSVVIQSGAIQITALPGQSPAVLGEEFEKRLLGVIRRISRDSL